MEQPDKTLSDAIAQMERQLNTCRDSTSCNLPMTMMLSLAKILRDECDARRAIVRQAEHREQLNQGTAQRLTGEINERSQRQMEITGRLAELERLERRMVDPDRVAMGLTKALCNERHPPPACLDPGCWHKAAYNKTTERIRDLEAQVHALDHAIADVWALVEQTDGYGSPFWSEPGLDDTTPAQAVAAVLEHLRHVAGSGVATCAQLKMEAERHRQRYMSNLRALNLNPANAEAMAALNAADRQSDDDQVCGC